MPSLLTIMLSFLAPLLSLPVSLSYPLSSHVSLSCHHSVTILSSFFTIIVIATYHPVTASCRPAIAYYHPVFIVFLGNKPYM